MLLKALPVEILILTKKLLHKVLQEVVVEADYADQYVEALKAVREHTGAALKEFDTIIRLIKPKGSERLKLLQKHRVELNDFLNDYEDDFREDPLAKRKGF